MRTDDPWYDAVASGSGDHDAPAPATAAAARPPGREQRTRGGLGGATGVARSGGSAEPRGTRGPGDPGLGAHVLHDEPRDAHAAVYLAVQRSEAFQQVRRRYRRFVLPVSVAFLAWYLAYLTAATAAPEFMARPVAGVFNVAMAAGLAQFASTFLVTWAYVRHARLRRDELALELRWETQDLTRTHAGAPAPRTAWESMS